jgi:hypothetical protein
VERSLGICSCVAVIVSSSFGSAAPARTIHVDRDAQGRRDGSTWADAYVDLQSALAVAGDGDEIRVARGAYRPDEGAGRTPGDRTASFALESGVAIRGGFAGFGEPDPNARDIEAHETILSGDLGGDDEPGFGRIEENSYHVVEARAVGATAVLDGCTISGGNAIGPYDASDHVGGGAFLADSSAELVRCTFESNVGSSGGGMYISGGRPTLRSCRFLGNLAGALEGHWGAGGAIFDHEGAPLLVDCLLSGNAAGANGGGMYVWGGDAVALNCVFEKNAAYFGGGGLALGLECSPLLANCIVRGNTCNEGGAAIYSNESHPSLFNCTILGNKAVGEAGGIRAYVRSRPTLANCILWGNSDARGAIQASQLDIHPGSGCTYAIRRSCVQGWTGVLGGEGNHGEDPLIVNPSRWDLRGTPHDPSDDLFVPGDDRLLSRSPCVDAGENGAVPPDIADLDGDGDTMEPIPLDALGRPRFRDDPQTPDSGTGPASIVDMGACEGPDQGLCLSARTLRIPEGGRARLDVSLSLDPGGTVEVAAEVVSGDPDITLEPPAALTFDSSNFSLPRTITLAAAQDSDNLRGVASIRVSSSIAPTLEVQAHEDDDEPVFETLHVDPLATGDRTGASWADAHVNLQDALALAREVPTVREIRVARGTYRPAGPSGNRGMTFLLVPGVAVRGGYAGILHPEPELRDIRSFETILSGDLDANDGAGEDQGQDNSYHVLAAFGTDPGAILDGFTVTGGRAAGDYIDNRQGGGVYLPYGSKLTLLHCTFVDNFAEEGGGGLCSQSEDLDAINCSFVSNKAYEGGGAAVRQSALLGCLFRGNIAARGGGLYCPCTPLSLVNVTLADNSAEGDPYYGGGGICGDDDTEIALTNCILWGNRDPSGAGLSAQIDDQIYLDSSSVSFSCVQGWDPGIGGLGNLREDPRFADASAGDLHLRPDSPCVDAGTDDIPAELSVDLDGRPRLCETRVDIGAYELCPSSGSPYCLAVSSARVDAGASAAVKVDLTNPEPVQAFSFGVAHLPSVAVLSAIDVEGCPVMEALNGGSGPDFLEVDLEAGTAGCDDGRFAGGTVYCIASREHPLTDTIPAGSAQSVARLTYTAPAQAAPGSETPLHIVGCLGDFLPWEIRLTVNFRSRVPEVHSGTFTVGSSPSRFLRGDPNLDGKRDISDAVAILGYLFQGAFDPECLDALDADDTGDPDITDAVYLLSYLFLGGPAPREPFSACGPDMTPDALDCGSYPICP